MESSHPIISRPQMPDDQFSSLGDRRDSDPRRRDGSSRRSSTSRAASRGSVIRPRSASRQSQDSKRGRKGYQLAEDVDRGLVKIIDGTDVPFETVAQAVEDVGGPKKLWLRKRFEQITGTKSFGALRLLNHRPSAEDRKQRTLMAMDWANDLDRHANGQGQPDSDMQQASSHDLTNGYRRPDRSSQRMSHASTASTTRAFANGNASPAQGRGPVQNWAAPGPKRTLSEDDKDGTTGYVANGVRARALSISSITRQLENLTGNTGFYEFIRRGSMKSHVSPLFRPSWWSSNRGSRATSGRTSFPEARPYSQLSPLDRRHVIYVPDPTYEAHYHAPTSDDIASANESGAAAVALLLRARKASITDEATRAELARACPTRPEDLKRFLNQPDKNGVTALHLAVAYGFQQVAVFLMHGGINPRALTKEGSSVCRFAKPAQELALGNVPLFHRILNSREWVCAGLPPRLPKEQTVEEKISPTYRSLRSGEAIPTLSRVDEASTPEPDQRPQAHAAVSEQSGLAPLDTTWSFPQTSEPGLDQRNSSAMYSSGPSPTSNDPHLCVHDFGNLLTPESIPRSAYHWSMDPSSPRSRLSFPPSSQAGLSFQQSPGSFANQPSSSEIGPFGYNILSGAMDQPMSAVTSAPAWPQPYSAGPNFPAQTTQFHEPCEDFFAGGGEQFNGQVSNGVAPLMNSTAGPTNYGINSDYSIVQGRQSHAQYNTVHAQPLFPTPSEPQESGWATNQNWTNWNSDDVSVSHATARALEATFQNAWHPSASQGTRRNDDYMYYQTDPDHHFQ